MYTMYHTYTTFTMHIYYVIIEKVNLESLIVRLDFRGSLQMTPNVSISTIVKK